MSILVILGLSPLGGTLYRLRGGYFSNLARKYGWEWGSKQRTNVMRAIWSIPTGLLLYYGGAYAHAEWYWSILCIASVWASLALYGHGAHVVFTMRGWLLAWSRGEEIGTTELLTSWWLPRLFGGAPDITWDDSKLIRYNLLGMGFVGVVRNLTAALPIIMFAPVFVVAYALLGATHGLLYWLGQTMVDHLAPVWLRGEEFDGGEIAEFLVGATTYAAIGGYFFG
jgi:hypothetical protein